MIEMPYRDENAVERVTAWRLENRDRYNEYMRHLRKTNPKVNAQADLRRARARAAKAGRPFDDAAWMAGRRQRQANRHGPEDQ